MEKLQRDNNKLYKNKGVLEWRILARITIKELKKITKTFQNTQSIAWLL